VALALRTAHPPSQNLTWTRKNARAFPRYNGPSFQEAPVLSLLVASALVVSIERVHPPDYSESSLCDLWAGARCYATQCLSDRKQRCTSESAKCRGANASTVPPPRADRVAACAKALLTSKCGEPLPAECEGVDYP
jgi:hypothetical protein